MKIYDRRSGNCNLSNIMQSNQEKNFFGTLMGFEPIALVLAMQCSNQLSYEDPYIGSRPIC